MGATWNLSSGYLDYPGSSFNAQHQTLHNIHLDDPDDPYGAAKRNNGIHLSYISKYYYNSKQ